jgi:hypothetical protein
VAQQPESFSAPAFAPLLARSLLASRAMAAVDVSRVVALTNKAVTLEQRGHYARAAEIYAEAVFAAQALHQPDCIIVADMQASHANALLGHAKTAGVPEARRVELSCSAYFELLPAAMASLERRLAADTLLTGACRPHEEAWFAATSAHAQAYIAQHTTPNAAAVHLAPAADTYAWSAYVGYDAYIRTASIALQLCAVGTDMYAAQALSLLLSAEATTADACSVFVERALDMIQRRTAGVSVVEAALVANAQILIDKNQRFRTSSGIDWHARILDAWRRLQSSGMLQRRGILQGVSVVTACNTHQTATAAATAAARGLRVCALHTCGAQEVHASQFKRCAACSSVVYCCKEHQVQDWPAHKAPCRAAARKAAEAADN